MKLSIKDRLTVLDVLPQQGNRLEMSLCEDIYKKITITQEETKKIGLRAKDNTVGWDEKKAKEVEIKFSDLEIDFIKEAFVKWDKEGKFRREMLSTDKKFR